MIRAIHLRALTRRQQLLQGSSFGDTRARNVLQQGFASTHNPVKGDDVEDEKEAGKDNAGFMGTAVTSVLGEAKEKAKSALGMKEKTLSQDEDMGPAGFMENKGPDTDPREEYSRMKDKSQKQWKSSTGDRASEVDPTSLYRGEKNSAKQNEDPPVNGNSS